MNAPTETPRIGRRSLLALAGAAAAVPATGLAAKSAPGRRFDPADPASFLQGFRKVLFADHEEAVFWWMKGTKYGIVDNVTTPFFNMEVATILRCRDLGPASFAVTSLELVYYTDLVGGELVERWQNPYTGEWLDMSYVPLGPTRIPYTVSGPQLPTELPGAKLEPHHSMGPATVVGDDVWIRNDNDSVVTRADGQGRPFRVHDWAVYHARLRDVEDGGNRSPEADVSFLDITSWPQSLKMGDRPGTRMSRCAGRKVPAFGGLPQSFRTLLERRHPEIHRDPVGALDAGPHRFER